MKKNALYLVLFAVGLFLGWLIFSGPATEETGHQHEAGNQAAQMYTCSMHPQIMQPEPGDCPICGMDLIAAESGAEGLAVNQFRLSEQAVALANVQTTTIGISSPEGAALELSGKITPNEETTVVQSAYFGGRIESLHINITGAEVKKGALLARMYSPELVAAQQELITAMALKEQQPRLYEAVRNKLKLWKLTENQIRSIEEKGQVQEYFPVYATVSGTVTEKLVNEGDYVKQGQPLFRIANFNKVWAILDAYEQQLGFLQTGQALTLTTQAYPGKEFNSEVSFIDPVVNTGSRTTRVRAVLSNKDGSLKSGMFVKATLSAPAATLETEVLLTPKSAVMWTGKRSVVYVQDDPSQPVYELREVELGKEYGEHYEVLAGLKQGERVVTQGTFTIDAAAQLQGKPSMMNRESKEEEEKMADLKLSSAFQDQLWPYIQGYTVMNEAFVASDPSGVKQKASALLTLHEKLDVSSLGRQEKTLINRAGQMITTMVNSDDIEKQRAHLVVLSDIVIALAAQMDELPQELYVQNCPMANQNKGANWISFNEEVLNPYYGDAMLHCGSITDTLKTKQ